MAYMRNNNNGRRHNNYNNNRPRHHSPNYQGNQGNQGNQQRRFVNRSNQVLESTGPEGRLRGTAQQLVEKYTALARDAASGGDPVLLQNYWQHAEHYQRLVNEIQEETASFEREREAQRQQQAQNQPTSDTIEIADGAAPVEGSEQPRTEQRSDQRPERRHESRQQHQRPREPRRDIEEDNELPSFLQPPVDPVLPPTAAEPVIVERPVRARAPRKPVADEGVE